jgi:hypothetical protein
MKHLRRVRLAGAAALLAASLATTGGALLATASPASAASITTPPITVSCVSLTGQVAADLGSAAGTLNQCNLVPIPLFFNGAVTLSPLDLAGGPSPGTITWATIGTHVISSTIVATAAAFVGDCSAVPIPGAIPATINLTITGGVGQGLAGSGVICVNPLDLTFVSAGAVTLSGSVVIPLPPI